MTRVLDGKIGSRKTGLIASWLLFVIFLVPLLVVSILSTRCGLNPDLFALFGVYTGLFLAAALFYTFGYQDTPNQPDYESIEHNKKSKWV